MDPLRSYELARLQMAERHQEAARARMATSGRSLTGVDEEETSVWRRWTLRKLVGRISLANAGA
jgi:hypothetical protein